LTSSKKSDAVTSRVNASQADLARIANSWSSAAPRIFATYQSVDRSRLELLKECLAKYETMHNDIGRERMELAEKGLVDLLSYEVDNDMRQFVGKQGGGRVADLPAVSDERSRPTPAAANMPSAGSTDLGETRSTTSPPLIRPTCQSFHPKVVPLF
jgi:hypothetical protein